MREKELLKKSGYWTVAVLAFFSLFWLLFCAQPCKGGYTGGPQSGVDVGINSRSTAQSNWQVGSSGVYVIRLGIENVTGLGTATGYMTGTNTYYPRIEWTPTLGTFNFVGTGSYPVTVQISGVGIPSASSVSGKINAVGGTGTGNIFTDTTLAGLGTITASFGANGLVISPAEYASVNNATGELQAQITTATGSITNHTHTGSDGTTQVSHTNLTSKGTQTHTQIDDFIASKAVASGVASLDANSLVVQNPASGTSTSGSNKIVMSDGTGKIVDGWLSNNITKLGTPTTSNIPEGSNLYHTEARVNTLIGSSSITSPQVSPKITFISPAVGQFLKIVDAQGNVENGTSSASIGFDAVTGSVSSNSNFKPNIPKEGKVLIGIPYYSELLGTTTAQNSGSNTITYTQLSPMSYRVVGTQTALLLKFNNPGSSTFTDEGDLGFSVLTTGNAIGTNTSGILGTGGLGLYGGANDYVGISHNNIFNLGANKFTLGFRIRLDTITSTAIRLISKFQNADNHYGIAYQGDNTLRIGALQAGGAAWNLLFSVPFIPATGTTYVIEYDRNGAAQSDHHVFINGSKQNTTFIAGGWDGAFDTNTGTFTVGGDNRSDQAWINVKGMIDNFYLINGAAWHTGTYTVPSSEYSVIDTYNQNIHRIVAPDNRVLMSFVDFGTRTTSEGSTTVYMYGSLTVFNSQAPLATSTLHAIHANGGILSNLGHFTQCFDSIKVITDDNKASLRSKYLDSFYDIKVKESFSRKGDIPWLDATDRAKKKYKQEKYVTWKSANIGLAKYYVNEFLPGSGTVQSFQVGAFETDYNNYSEESWASDLTQNDYIQDVKDEQDMDRTKKMLRPSLSDPLCPAIIKAGDGSALSLDDTSALSVMAIQDLNERLESATAEIEAVKWVIEELKALMSK